MGLYSDAHPLIFPKDTVTVLNSYSRRIKKMDVNILLFISVMTFSLWGKRQPDGLWQPSRKAAGLHLLCVRGLAARQEAFVFFALCNTTTNISKV